MRYQIYEDLKVGLTKIQQLNSYTVNKPPETRREGR